MRLLFVCLGNICRSPIAQGIAEDIIKKKNLDWEVDSAGTSSWHKGENPCTNSIKVAMKNSIDISKQKSRPLKVEDFDKFDVILALDSSNLNNITLMRDSDKVFKLGFFGLDSKDIPDPYEYVNFSGFEKVFDMIYKSVECLIKDLTEKGELGQL